MKKLIMIPIWNRKLLIVTYPTDILKATIDSKMKRVLISMVRREIPDKSSCSLLYFDDKLGNSVLWFPNRKPRNDTLIHETNHLTKFMLKAMGAQQEHEAHAYTQEWLYNNIKKALKNGR